MIRLLFLALLGLSLAAPAQQRSFEPIGDGTDAGVTLPPRDRTLVEEWLESLAQAWNTPRLAPLLDPAFPERRRLLGALEDRVPPDARLRVLSVGPVRVLSESRETDRIVRTLRIAVRWAVEGTGADGSPTRRETQQKLVVEWVRRVPQ